MLRGVVESFLDSLSERELDVPLAAVLQAEGFVDIVTLHGQYEFGKDLIAKDSARETQFGFQSKAGDLRLSDWASIEPQLDLLRRNEIAHPAFDRSLPRVGVLVTTGQLLGGAAPAAQDYQRRADERGEAAFTVWDRGRLVEMFLASLPAGLAGAVDGPLLELLGRIDAGRVTDAEIERYSRRWIVEGSELEWRSLLEAGLIANRLRVSDRLDLACVTPLALLRGLWASAHGAEPPSATVEAQAELIRGMFLHYAGELWELCTEHLLDPRELIATETEAGVFVHYPVRCARLVETMGLYGLVTSDRRDEVEAWVAGFLGAQPGAAHPISDRWAVSLIPPLILLDQVAGGGNEAFLRNAIKWVADRHDKDGSGLAATDASPDEEVAYLLGDPLEGLGRPSRGVSYAAGVILDLAAALELPETYELAHNELLAVEARPMVTIPDDDRTQYLLSEVGVDVPVYTDPGYRSEWSADGDWRMAGHHYADAGQYYLCRIGRAWDQLAMSLVLRDRHSVMAIRALLEEGRGTNT